MSDDGFASIVLPGLQLLSWTFANLYGGLLIHSASMTALQANNRRQDRIEQELWQLRTQVFAATEGVRRASGRLDGMAMEMSRMNGVLERTNQGIQGLQATMQTILQRLDGGPPQQ